MVCFLTSRFSEEGCVQLLDCRIFVGFADWVVFVGVVENFGAQAADIYGVAHIARLLRLAATVDATARAAHDLDEVVGCFTGFNLLKQLLCVSKTGGDGNLDFQARNRVGGFLDAFHAADVGEVQIL